MIYRASAKCGCVVAGVVDDPRQPSRTASDVAEFIRDGWTIDRVADLRFTKCNTHNGMAHKDWCAALDRDKSDPLIPLATTPPPAVVEDET